MSLSIGELSGYVTLDDSKFEKGLDASQRKFKSFGDRLRSSAEKVSKWTGRALVAGLVAGAAAAKAMVSEASDLNETVNKSQVIFGAQFAAMNKWAKGASTAMGLSRRAALDAASGFGDMFSQLGFTGAQAAKMSRQVVQMSADLGSFSNLDTAEVADMMSAAFRGEYDSLQRLIPNINAARVEQVALEQTGKKAAKQLTAQEKAAATLAIVHKDGSRAAGDFARTSDGLANQQKILKARLEDVQGELGTKLLPVMTKVLGWIVKAVDWGQKHEKTVGTVAVAIGGLTAALWLASTAIKAVDTITKVFTASQKLLNLVLRANPIGIVITVLAALAVGLVYAYKKSETFRNIVDGVFKAVGRAASFMWDKVIKPVFKFWINTWLTVVGAMLNGAAKAFGWMPGIGGKLKGVAADFKDFKKDVNRELNGVKKTVTVHANTRPARSAIADLRNTLISLTTTRYTPTVTVQPRTGGIADLLNPKRAGGGGVAAGRSYVIGERGPEVLTMGLSGGFITSHAKSRMLGLFDTGGLARGAGLMVKGPQPERVLSPRQTQAFERLVAALEKRGGGSGQTLQFVNYDVDRVLFEMARREALGSVS